MTELAEELADDDEITDEQKDNVREAHQENTWEFINDLPQLFRD
jgi:hypothetical protein